MFVAAVASICITTSCSKEEAEDSSSMHGCASKNISGIANADNPYDYCGQLHNEILDYVIENNPNPSDIDIYNLSKEFMQQKNIFTNLDYEDIGNGYGCITNIIIDAFLNSTSFNEVYNNGIISEVFDSLVGYARSMINTNILSTPSEYASRLTILEGKVINKRTMENIPQDSISEYDVALGALAIARYSYYYWFKVANDPDSPWNNIIQSKKQNENDEPNFWGKLLNVLGDVAKVVVKVAVTPIADAAGFVWEGMEEHEPTPGFVGFAFNIHDGIIGAGNWSGNVWNW